MDEINEDNEGYLKNLRESMLRQGITGSDNQTVFKADIWCPEFDKICLVWDECDKCDKGEQHEHYATIAEGEKEWYCGRLAWYEKPELFFGTGKCSEKPRVYKLPKWTGGTPKYWTQQQIYPPEKITLNSKET